MSDKGMGNGPAAGPIADAPDGTLRLDSTKAAEAIKAAAALVRRLRDDRFWRPDDRFWRPADIVSSALRNNAANYIEWLHLRIRELEAQREWMPIESAPKDGTSIIYLDRRECIGEAFWQDKDEHEPGWWDEANTEEVKPTHWTPLPDLPAAVQVAEGSPAGALHPTPKPDDREGR
jgi:hypothetical protein